MTTAQLIIVCLTVLTAAAVAGGIAYFLVRSSSQTRLALARIDAAARIRTPDAGGPPRRVGHRVTVHTNPPADLTFFGVISAEYSDRVVLEDAELVTGTGAQPLPGRQDIATSDISWIDVHALVAPMPDRPPAPTSTDMPAVAPIRAG